jgi:hypothetical protein
MNFKQFLDVVIAELYQADTGHSGDYFNLRSLLAKVSYPQGWLWDAVDVLASQGYISAQKLLGGDCIARITGPGRVLKEDGGQAEFVKSYEENPVQYHVGSISLVTGGSDLSSLLNEIQMALKSSQEISRTEKEDIKVDLETIEKQLNKNEPNKTVAISILERLMVFSELVIPIRKFLDFLDSVT